MYEINIDLRPFGIKKADEKFVDPNNVGIDVFLTFQEAHDAVHDKYNEMINSHLKKSREHTEELFAFEKACEEYEKKEAEQEFNKLKDKGKYFVCEDEDENFIGMVFSYAEAELKKADVIEVFSSNGEYLGYFAYVERGDFYVAFPKEGN